MLKIENLSKAYGDKKIKAVDNISLEVKPGKFLVLWVPMGLAKPQPLK